MKFSVVQELFSESLGIVSKAIASNNTLQVLDNVLLKAEGSVLSLTATDLEISIHTHVDVVVEEEGKITIPARMLTQYVGLLPAGELIQIHTTGNNGLSLTSTTSDTIIKGISADEFPSIPAIDPLFRFEIKRSLFLESVTDVLFSTSSNATRPVLSGVTIMQKEDSLYFVSTDSFRLSEKKIPFTGGDGEPFKFIVPAKTMQELVRIASKEISGEENVQIACSKNQVEFSYGEIKLISRLIEGTLPEYGQIIPKEVKTSCVVDIASLSTALKRMNLFAKEHNFSVKFTIRPEEKRIFLSSDATQIGEEKASVPLQEPEGEEVTIALNSLFVLDILNTIGSGSVSVFAAGSNSPIVFRKRTEKNEVDQEYLHLIMPLRA